MKKYLLFKTLILAITIFGLSSCSNSVSRSSSSNENAENELITESNSSEQYKIIIYDDDSGDFLAPDGARICGVNHTNGRSSKMDVYLTKEVKIFGVRTNRLQFIDGRLFASYQDYLSYSNGKGDDNSVEVNVDENDNRTIFSFTLNPNDVENFETTKVDLSSLGDNYKMVMYGDDTGALYDSNNQRVCGLMNTPYETVDYEWRFGKETTILGKKVERLAVYKGYLFYSAMDKVWDDRGDTKYRIAKVTETHQGDATILSFPNERLSDTSESSSYDNSGSTYAWGISSTSQLENKIKGTIWTCRPTGRTWYRLDFKGNRMYLSYAEPQMGRWIGYMADQNENNIYAYRIQEMYTSDTGEKYMSIQLHHVDDDFALGSLNFFKNGDVEFSWLRGKYGGPAECKDFNWE